MLEKVKIVRFYEENAGKAELYRDLNEIFESDNRHGQPGEEYLQLIHRLISEVKLFDAVPKDVYLNFETAKNTLLYSNYCYRLSMPAVLFSIASLEMAIHYKGKLIGHQFSPHHGLMKKLKTAIDRKWIDIRDVSPRQGIAEKQPFYDSADSLIKFIVDTRNNLAHEPWFSDSPHCNLIYFNLVASMINSMYK